IWLLDEPDASLDAATITKLVAVVKAHLDAGGIAVISTHNDLPIAGEVLNIGDFRATAPASDPWL
ncbi:MAG: heme ABC transporter ATP-binding protein CcmA, partial [Pseudomonadota bacterium]